ncbi:alpha/beta fold hydrolase [Fodinibius salsisoli]|uniref:Alpha/beta hydrolase n=1 Tax=Fodinibius salsisoli TaxID=2820877 RepID=A0ABT3PLF8_9BACT|nr:alpha/beta hydrolase [Fodinibius salsisoli]MCW9706785.1 alpha/beta hydrolase [Fodinibius salsisoli]
MYTLLSDHSTKQSSTSNSKYRGELLADIPATEHRMDLAGISTAVLVSGEGEPIILLHGPGETSLWWMRVIPGLVKNHRLIVPDLPGHGASKVSHDALDTDLVFQWLSELITKTCSTSPILVGHILGGAISARFAVNHGEQIKQLVLVDSLGLDKFRPTPGFAFGLFRFMIWPTEKNFDKFFPHCMYDVDELQNQMGEKWKPFVEYNLECARDKERSDALQLLMKTLGIPKIPDDDLQKIDVPTALIWGRHDKANKLKIAHKVSQRYGWPLHIIEKTRDDPKLERPGPFMDTLSTILQGTKP